MTAELFNALDEDVAAQRLRACCAAPQWIAAMLNGRPYRSVAAALENSVRALAVLDWTGVRQALDAHPRIGERVAGGDREARWSRQEQSGTATSSTSTKAALIEANQDYEDRFGHVFLIFATGRTDTEMLAAAQSRLTNDVATERRIVRAELGKIVALRLERMLAE